MIFQSSEFWIEWSKEIENLNIAPIGTASFFFFRSLSGVEGYEKEKDIALRQAQDKLLAGWKREKK